MAILLIGLSAGEGRTEEAFPELRRLYQVAEERADFVFVLDTSGSMRPFYDQVRRVCIEFLKALPPEDNLHFLCFDRQVYLISPAGVKARDWAQIGTQIPTVPRGAYTDIGSALDQVLAILSRPNACSLAFVIFITDGKHEPPPESLYSADTRSGRWVALQQSAREIAKKKTLLRIFSIGLERSADARLLARVFGSEYTSVLFTHPAQLQSYLRQVQNELIAARLKSCVQNDIAKQKITIPAHVTSKVVHLQAGTQSAYDLPLISEFKPLSVAWRTQATEQVIKGVRIVIPAAERRISPVDTASGSQSSVSAVRIVLHAPPSTQRLTLKSKEQVPVKLTIPYSAVVEPADEIRQLGLSPQIRLRDSQGQEMDAIPIELTVIVEHGVSWRELLVRWIGISVLAILAAFALWYFTPKPIGWIVYGFDQYPLSNQREATKEWTTNLFKMICLTVILTTVGAVVGFLVGQWWSFYAFQLLLGLIGVGIGYRLWGQKGVRVGRVADAHLGFDGAERTWVIYCTSTDMRAKPFPKGADKSLYADPAMDLGGGIVVEWAQFAQ